MGAVLVYQHRIIGEGFHRKHGTAHAEVNALASVRKEDQRLIDQSTLYVSLEPCCIYGSTPPCTNLIIEHHIPKVVFSCIDQTAGVLGKSIQLLRNAGVEVITHVLKEEGEDIALPRTVYATQRRPYVILKYAVSANGFIGNSTSTVWMSNPISKRLVHRWRSESNAILVGTNTAALDNPALNNRLFYGPSPLRIVFDKKGRLDHNLALFNGQQPTWVLTESPKKIKTAEHLRILEVPFDEKLLPFLLKELHDHKIGILLVEGGQLTLQAFINQNLWDEARVFKTTKLIQQHGVKAPDLSGKIEQIIPILSDQLQVFRPAK